MQSQRGTITLTSSSWQEISPTFDITSYGVYSAQGDFYIQEYYLDAWGTSILVSTGDPYHRATSIRKIRFLAVTGSIEINYTLTGFVASRINGEEVSEGSGGSIDTSYDGGFANSVFLPDQTIDGGGA